MEASILMFCSLASILLNKGIFARFQRQGSKFDFKDQTDLMPRLKFEVSLKLEAMEVG